MAKRFHNGVTIISDNEGKMEIQTKNKTIIVNSEGETVKIEDKISDSVSEPSDGTNYFLEIRPIKGCKNLMSYGEICVRCNKCGRFYIRIPEAV